jgi:hypothetical protein
MVGVANWKVEHGRLFDPSWPHIVHGPFNPANQPDGAIAATA